MAWVSWAPITIDKNRVETSAGWRKEEEEEGKGGGRREGRERTNEASGGLTLPRATGSTTDKERSSKCLPRLFTFKSGPFSHCTKIEGTP